MRPLRGCVAGNDELLSANQSRMFHDFYEIRSGCRGRPRGPKTGAAGTGARGAYGVRPACWRCLEAIGDPKAGASSPHSIRSAKHEVPPRCAPSLAACRLEILRVAFPKLSLVTLSCLALGLFTARALSPQVALEQMKVADGFEVKLVAHEPDIRKPLSITFDERGRLWVIQYLQYPTPAGLKPVSVDQYLRTKYDRVPEPPPRGPKGADRITICEDTDGDGRFDKFKDFVGGLNLAPRPALRYGGRLIRRTPCLLVFPGLRRNQISRQDPDIPLIQVRP